MILKSLRLTNFKNHSNAVFSFENGINCIIGQNGLGKTNLLDAIYYLSFSKSGLGSIDRQAITHGEHVFTIFGNYEEHQIGLQFEKGRTKSVKVDGILLEKISDLVGKIPLIMVLPDDTSMIKEGSEDRRKFFDGALSQLDHDYLHALILYNKLVKQRNAYLKQVDHRSVDANLVGSYDDQLIPLAKDISEKRGALVDTFLPYLEKNYADLHEGTELPSLRFKTHVDAHFEQSFKDSLPKDLIMQRTLLGSHRDDFEFLLDEVPIKRFGSQGQQKTFILSLKLALYDFLKENLLIKPILLLDDIFDKLDDSRINLLVSLLADTSRFGQIFITDARLERTRSLFAEQKEVHFIKLT